jgi:hypothetical protein
MTSVNASVLQLNISTLPGKAGIKIINLLCFIDYLLTVLYPNIFL